MAKNKNNSFNLLFLGLVNTLLLSSCFQIKLRDDISNFITPFSYEKAIKEYKAASYILDDEVVYKNENNATETTHEEFNFDRKSLQNISFSYLKQTSDKEGNTKLLNESIRSENGQYFYTKNEEEEVSCTLEFVNGKIDRFFYNNVDESYLDNYHGGGMYFGDQLLETASRFQNHIDIDEENKLLIVQYIDVPQSDGTIINQLYHVDEFGMLVDYYLKLENDVTVKTTTIALTKK